MEKTEQNIKDEFNERFKKVFEDIKKLKFLHRNVISADFKSGAFKIIFEDGVNSTDPDIQKSLHIAMDMLGEAGMRVAWLDWKNYEKLLDDILASDFKILVPLTIFFMVGSLFFSFRNIFGMLLPLFTVTIAGFWVGGIMGYFDIPINIVTISLPVVIMCVGNDYAIHFLNFYFINSREKPEASKKEIIIMALHHLTVPLSVTSLTTIIGFSALAFNEIPAIREFGIFSSLGVLISIILTLTTLPAILLLLPKPKLQTTSESATPKKNGLDLMLDLFTKFTEKYPSKIIWSWGVLCLIMLVGIGLVKVDGETLALSDDHPFVQDLRYIEENFTGRHSVTVILKSKNSTNEFKTANVILSLQQINDWALQINGPNEVGDIPDLLVNRVNTVAEYIDMHRLGLDNMKDKEVRTYFDRTADRYGFPTFLSNDQSMMMVVIDFTALPVPSQIAFMDLVKEKTQEMFPEFSIRLTGETLLSAESQDNIIYGQIQSITLALIFIFVILSALFLSIKMGAISILPNLIPLLIFFGTLGLLGISISVTVSMIAAIALAIGVDDTIHYLSHYNENLKKARNEQKAAILTIHETGRPMFLTTVSLGLGFIVFILSDMNNQQVFGVLMAYTFAICLICDMNFLPSVMSRIKMITAWDYIGLKMSDEMMKAISLFKGLTVREAKLATLMAYVTEVKKGDTIFRENDFGHELFIVMEGEINFHLDKEFHKSPEHLANFKMGDSFGVMGLFGKTKRLGTATAVKDSSMLVLNIDHLIMKILSRYPKIAIKLFENLAVHISLQIKKGRNQLIEGKSRLLTEARENPDKYLEVLVKLVDDIIADGVISIEEQEALDRLIYADGVVSQGEQEQLNRIHMMIEKSLLKEEKPLHILIDEIIDDGIITFDERTILNKRIYADHHVDEDEKKQLSRLNKLIQDGKVHEENPVYQGIFQGFTSTQIQWMKEKFPSKGLAPDTFAFQNGEDVKDMLIVLKGKLTLSKELFGNKLPIATVFEGDVIDTKAVFCGEDKRNVDAIVLEQAEIMRISREEMNWLSKNKVKLAARLYYNLLCKLSEELSHTMKELQSSNQ